MGIAKFSLHRRREALHFGQIVDCAGPYEVKLPPPVAVTGSDLLRSETRVNIKRPRCVYFPPVERYIVERALLIGQCLVVSEAGEAVLETIAPHRQAGYASKVVDNGVWGMPREATREISGLTLVLPVSAASMSHFVFEGLSHLVTGMPDITNIVIGTTSHSGFSDLVDLALGKKVNVLYRPPELYTEAWLLERALVPIYRFNFHPGMTTSLDNIITACRQESANSSEYLYISRQDVTRYRIMINEDRIIKLMRTIGFEILELNNMAEVDIVRKFNKARMIVGPVGAGLYNSIFSPQDCTVLALCAPNYLRSLIDQCAALRGIRRAYCFGPDFLSYESEQQGGHNDFVVDEDSLLETVLSLLEDTSRMSTL